MKSETILVIGSSGTVGTELVRLLKAEGHHVRSATSQKPRHGDQVQLNLINGEGMKQAFEGADKAFFISPPGYSDQYAILSPLIQEAKRRGLKKVVLMTALGVNHNDASPFRRAEIELEKSGLKYNIIRPNWFFQNFNTFWIQGIRDHGQIALPAANSKTSFIDSRDISAVAAKLLTTNRFDDQALDLTGPEALDHSQVATALSAASGRRISYVNVEPETLKAGLLSAGLPEDYSNLLLTLFGLMREGYNSAITTEVQNVLGRKSLSLSQYAEDYKNSWQ